MDDIDVMTGEPAYLASTRTTYDTVAAEYAARMRPDLAARPLDRALLDAFADLVRAAGGGAVADLGCGPGYVTEYLRGRGLDVFGVDLSPRTVALARRAHPGLRFEVGTMTALELPDGALRGAVALFSIIHTPPEDLPGLFAELHRVLAPGAELMLAFQVGDERRHGTEWHGHQVSFEAYKLPPERVAGWLERAGFVVHARVVREPEGDVEKVPRAWLLARRPAAATTGPPAL